MKTCCACLRARLDNVVYRMGFAVTRAQARQLVSHKSVMVNGKKVNMPSYVMRPGDEIELTENAQKQLRVQEAMKVSESMDLKPGWIEVDARNAPACSSPCPIAVTCPVRHQ